ncbi:MAG TPA: hypothetical protein VFE98_02075 [Candidatus Bathyarchaeia archaeon]|nr:hypothetical protein [Candidatus Bathyarchaeia archaeon]
MNMPRPTKDDALLIIRLREIFPLESSRWVQFNFSAKTYDEFEEKCPKGSTERAHVSNVLSFYELAGTLDYYKLLSEDLFFDFGFQFWFNWEKLEPIIDGWRKRMKDEWIWDTTTWFANRMKAWWKKRPYPKTHQPTETSKTRKA